MRVQLVDLLLIQLSNYRRSWRGMIVTGVCAPLMSVIALGLLAEQSGQTNLLYVLTGSVVLSPMFQNQNNVANNFAFVKAVGTLDFFATLPVYRHVVIVATVPAFFLLSIPSLLVTIVAGSLFLGVPLHVTPLAIIVMSLCVMPMVGIGALIGILTRTPEEAGSTSLLVTISLLFLGPVILPPDALPGWLLSMSHISPTSYAASAIRQVGSGPVTGQLWIDMGVLAGLTLLTLWFVGRKIRWQER
ncbi:ABC transporter permease [Streptosporangium sp. NPDC023825]|uniref:ABC transporter permease n=1 Tax=Streptosporangium sp. NPDC023825 TaxID=3154909 RepID=UPI0034135A98